MKVWSFAIRCMHWSLVASVLVAWVVAERRPSVHLVAGYVALVIVLLRVVWGFAGPRYARFSQFVRGPRRILDYALLTVDGREPRYIGHNPLGGWMVVMLIACVLALAFTGWLYTTDRFWGELWLDRLHAGLAWTLVVLVAAHVSGVVFTSFRHRENLVFAMVHGIKRAPSKDDLV